jgi:hypothetical protein
MVRSLAVSSEDSLTARLGHCVEQVMRATGGRLKSCALDSALSEAEVESAGAAISLDVAEMMRAVPTVAGVQDASTTAGARGSEVEEVEVVDDEAPGRSVIASARKAAMAFVTASSMALCRSASSCFTEAAALFASYAAKEARTDSLTVAEMSSRWEALYSSFDTKGRKSNPGRDILEEEILGRILGILWILRGRNDWL